MVATTIMHAVVHQNITVRANGHPPGNIIQMTSGYIDPRSGGARREPDYVVELWQYLAIQSGIGKVLVDNVIS